MRWLFSKFDDLILAHNTIIQIIQRSYNRKTALIWDISVRNANNSSSRSDANISYFNCFVWASRLPMISICPTVNSEHLLIVWDKFVIHRRSCDLLNSFFRLARWAEDGQERWRWMTMDFVMVFYSWYDQMILETVGLSRKKQSLLMHTINFWVRNGKTYRIHTSV